MTGAVAIDLDGALGDTRPLWNDWLASVSGVLGVDLGTLPVERGEAAAELDRRGAGNWRILLHRFAEERAAVYIRRDADVSAALRALTAADRRLGVFSDAPESLARVALAQLGADRRLVAVETGSGALERLLERLGADTVVVRSRLELLEGAA
ncbi:hypothetical protein BH20ACT14_BH20ACT14_16080 [soil metagenome]|nr:hypothetical protein [Actinomycetota bacterium]